MLGCQDAKIGKRAEGKGRRTVGRGLLRNGEGRNGETGKDGYRKSGPRLNRMRRLAMREFNGATPVESVILFHCVKIQRGKGEDGLRTTEDRCRISDI